MTIVRYSFFVATLLLAVVLTAAWSVYGWTVEGAQAATRYTARLGFLFYSLVFILPAFSRWAPGHPVTRELIANRRRLGLTFGYVHIVHLGFVVLFLWLSGVQPTPSRLAGGILAYSLLFAMMATSNDFSVRKLGSRNWKRLHTVGIYYLWFVFFMTYLPRVQGKIPVHGSRAALAPWFVTLLVILAIRLTAKFAPQRKRLEARQHAG
jgi:DMSO/TMAO reductase YedYZ heme-binding membrane subunit